MRGWQVGLAALLLAMPGAAMAKDARPSLEQRVQRMEDESAIRKVLTRLHRIAPSLVGHPVEVVEARLKEEEDEVLKQLHTIDERLGEWQRSSSD